MASTPAQLAADARALLDGDSSAAAGLRVVSGVHQSDEQSEDEDAEEVLASEPRRLSACGLLSALCLLSFHMDIQSNVGAGRK